MYSRNHAVFSALVGLPVAIGAPGAHRPVLLWAYVVVVGVGIDVDHFVIARLNRGDWTNLWRCVRDPSRPFLAQETIFDRGDVWRDQRLLSHLVLGGLLVGGLWPLDWYWAFATALAVYTHVLSDLYSDGRTRDRYLERGN